MGRLDYFRDRGLTIPRLRYMGPRNALDRGPPINYADFIAMVHDYAYEVYLRRGQKPYIKYNNADEFGMQKLRHTKQYGATTYKSVFGLKRRVSSKLDDDKFWTLPFWSQMFQIWKEVHKLDDDRKAWFKFVHYYKSAVDWNDLKPVIRKLSKREGDPIQIDRQTKRQNYENPFKGYEYENFMDTSELDYPEISEEKETDEPDEKYPDQNMGGGPANSNEVSGRTRFTKLRKVHFKGRFMHGLWTPTQEALVKDYIQMSSAVNLRGSFIYNMISPMIMEKKLFTPFYFQEYTKNAGTAGLRGITLDWINSISGSNLSKSLFDMGAWTNPTTTNYQQWNATDSLTNVAEKMPTQFLPYVSVNTVATLYIRNNGNTPSTVIVTDWVSSEDQRDTSGPLSDNLFYFAINRDIEAGGWQTINWIPTNATDPAQVSPPTSHVQALTFNFNALPKGGLFQKNYSNLGVYKIELSPGEHASLKLRKTNHKAHLINLVMRLRAMGFDPSAGAGVGNGYVLAGFNRFLHFDVLGGLGHDEVGGAGHLPSALDATMTIDYKFKMKANKWKKIPSRYVNVVGVNPQDYTEAYAFS